MEVEDGERMIVARPVASRPSCSNFRSFSELLGDAIYDSPPTAITRTTVAIRPKTMRVKPSVNHPPVEVVSSLDGLSGLEFCNSSGTSVKTLKRIDKSRVIYKPMPKLVSKTTSSFLVNLGNFDVSHQGTSAQLQSTVHVPDQGHHHYQFQTASKGYQTLPSQSDTNIIDPTKFEPKNLEQNSRSQQPAASSDRLSYDGYNWRKYGQKQVKGSEYPRSYYKCTHPNCPVKKMVERSLDGQIAEIVYKGEHGHPKPQPPKRLSSGAQGKYFLPDGSGRDNDDLFWSNSFAEKIDASDCGMDNPSEVVLSVMSTYPRDTLFPSDSTLASTYDSGVGTTETSCIRKGDCEEGSRIMEWDHDEPNCKRRKNVDQASRVDSPAQGVQEPHVVVQSSIESDVMKDGFRWRKYGQKVVKGNPYPRSYYRCTSPKCNVRKHVERASDDPRSVITTYEGKHNHDMPSTNPHSVASDPDP